MEQETEPTEHFTLFSYTSKWVKKQVKRFVGKYPASLKVQEMHDTKTVSCLYLSDYSSKEFRATRTEAIAKARAYFEAIPSHYKSVTLFAYAFKAGKLIEQPIFSESTI